MPIKLSVTSEHLCFVLILLRLINGKPLHVISTKAGNLIFNEVQILYVFIIINNCMLQIHFRFFIINAIIKQHTF
jgi:hypothetical protein